MKKSIVKCTSAVLACALLLGGCGMGAKTQPKQEPVRETKIEQEKLPAAVETETENTDGETAADDIPAISITQDKKEWYTDDGETLLLTASASKIEVIGDGFDALKSALEAQWSGLDGKNYDEELGWAKEHYEMAKSDGIDYFANYAFDKNLALYRNDSDVISFCESVYDFSGGAHGMYGVEGVTFDVKSGRQLALEDILSNPEGFYGKAIEYIIKELDENYSADLFPEYKETVNESTFGETQASWHLNNAGIVIDYDLYLIAPYAAGMPSVTLPYDEFAEYIKEEYIKPHDNMAAGVSANEDVSRLLGEAGSVMIETVSDEEASTSEVTVVSGNSRENVGTFGRLTDAWAIKRDGRSFLIFVCDYASDDFVAFVYEVTGGKAARCDRIEGAGFGWNGNYSMGTDRIGLYMRFDILGSYSGWMEYSFGDDGKLTPMSDVYAIDTDSTLTVVKDLPVMLEGNETMLPVGTKMGITGTDNNGTAYFRLDTGEAGEIKYIRKEGQWGLTIDGVSEFDYFAEVPYAG